MEHGMHIMRNDSENNELHDAEVSSARKTAEEDMLRNSEGIIKHMEGDLPNASAKFTVVEWFSINKKGEHHEMISVAECLDNSRLNLVKPRYGSDTYYSKDRSPMGVYIYNGFDTYYSIDRFAVGVYIYNYHEKLKTHVKSQLLSPLTTYVVNFLFSFDFPKWECEPIILAYRLQGETKTSVSYLAYEIEDGIWACELFQFTSDSQIVDLEIMFEGFNECYELICVQGIEFRPMEKEEHKDENQSISDSDAYWEEKLPADYEDIMKWSTDILQWTTKKEAYSIIRKGFLIDDGEKWFFLHKNGKKCHKLSAAYIRTLSKDDEIHLSETRFKEATLLSSSGFSIKCKIESHLLSPQTTYATYLVYKYLPENQLRFEGPVGVIFGSFDNRWHVYLVSPTTPVIRPKADQNTHNPVHRPKIKGIPQQRNDGWMEVQIWEFRTAATIEMVPIDFYLDSGNHIPWEVRPGFPYKMVHSDLFSVNHNIPSFDGLVIQGFEVRPT
ncbi:hypothetical protein E3N88_43707 [Mikania micrantha]|uniref:Uncharacterized protein n=1 Tax=Mikania micrantha TaxID=192012 RepID=A0A5N6LE45_9ASTR|nr:hypothetical protein E3N88_43707 [Mikania micrantha]